MENPRPSNVKTVMVVDDYDAIRLLLKEHLEKLGHRVLQASDGNEAVEIAKREGNNLHLILMDLNLPVVDGLVATRRIRQIKESSDVPIIACTARSSEEQKVKAMEAGCTDFLAKPLDKKAIETILDRYLPKDSVASME
jgi:CheY-like chemotaxis protein